MFPYSVSAATYTTWNPSDKTADTTLSGGNLILAMNTPSGWKGARSILGVSSGKWYWEIRINSGSAGDIAYGLSKAGVPIDNPFFFGGSAGDGYGYNGPNGNKRDTPSGDSAYGSSFGSGGNDVLMTALDLDNGKIWFGLNGTWQASGDPAAGTNAAYTGVSGTYYATLASYEEYNVTANFGATALTYTVPSGFNAGLYTPDAPVPSAFGWLSLFGDWF